jgi:hypothetical protein
MGCLKLTYGHEETPTLFLESDREKNQSPDLQVWVNPDSENFGVGIKTQTQGGPPPFAFSPGSDSWNAASNYMTGIGMAIDGTAFNLGRALDKRLAYSPRNASFGQWATKSLPVGPTRMLGFNVSTGLAKSTATTLKVGGAALGAFGLGMTAVEYFNGNVSGFEATTDAVFGVIGFLGPVGAGVSILYFGGKMLYEYSSGETLFEKPR